MTCRFHPLHTPLLRSRLGYSGYLCVFYRRRLSAFCGTTDFLRLNLEGSSCTCCMTLNIDLSHFDILVNKLLEYVLVKVQTWGKDSCAGISQSLAQCRCHVIAIFCQILVSSYWISLWKGHCRLPLSTLLCPPHPHTHSANWTSETHVERDIYLCKAMVSSLRLAYMQESSDFPGVVFRAAVSRSGGD